MTLISELIKVPDVVHPGDFVLDLSRGVTDIERTLRDYVVTPELAARYDEALSLINSALTERSSKATYLDGSFGSGKSHFMAVLHALLQNHPAARTVGELAPVVAKYDDLISTKRLLMVPYHLVGKQTLEEAVFGGYLSRVAALHPDAPLPAVLIDAPLVDTAVQLRARLGDDSFFGLLGKTPTDAGWGDLATGWDGPRFEAALAAAPGSRERDEVISVLQEALSGFAELARSAGTGYVGIDDGLAAISQHAATLGYDGLVLFLDELVLWFATRMSDHTWVANEAPKVSKLVEAANPNRPAPIISFVARQRDLRELVGTSLPGTQHLAFADSLKWWEGRFGSVKLSDNNLPVIAATRVLHPRSDAARAEIDRAFAAMDQVRHDIRSALMTAQADRDAFRLTYPFSPAFVETLVALSGALQRERTALRVMQQLLVDQRDTLQLGQLVPVSDLFDVLVAGDEPISGELGALWRNAQKVYGDIRRLVLETHGLTEETAAEVPATHAVHRDDRIAKTLVLAALMPEVESMRDLTARKVVALNHGYIRSLVPGQEAGDVLHVVRQWAARLGTVQLTGDEANPLIAVRLEGVDIEGVLEKAKTADSTGARRQAARTLLFTALGARTDVGLDGVTAHTVTWRGTKQVVELVYGNVRDPSDLGDSMFAPSHGGWRLMLDYPFDDEGHTPVEDLNRAASLREDRPARTLCWVPRHFTAQAVRDLGRYVRLHYALGPSFDQLTVDLSDNDRAIARQQMTAQRDQLASRILQALLQAYGIVTPDETLVDTAHGGVDMFVSLQPGFTPKVPAGAGLEQAFENMVDQMLSWEFPAHPRFSGEVRPADRTKVHAQVRRAIEDPEHRIMVESGDRQVMTKVANPLRLGEQSAQYFVLGHHWEQHLNRKIAEAGLVGHPVAVGQLRAWLDEPERMGLPQEVADLVVLLFAEQTNRSVVVGGRTTDVSRLQPLPADAMVVEQPLPDEEAWDEARERAAGLFGVGDVTELLTARNVSVLAERARAAAAERERAARDLLTALRDKGPVVLGGDADPAGTERVRIADAALWLCEELTGARDDVALINALATAELPAVPLHMAKSLDMASSIVTQIRRVDWNILATVAGWGPDHPLGARAADMVAALAEVWQANEYAKHLQPALGLADHTAKRLLIEAQRPSLAPAPPPTPGPTPPETQGDRVVNAETVDEVAGILTSLARQGNRVRVTWRVER